MGLKLDSLEENNRLDIITFSLKTRECQVLERKNFIKADKLPSSNTLFACEATLLYQYNE